MKILRVCPAPGYTKRFRAAKKLRDKTFKEQVDIYRSENVILPGDWAAAMEARGCEVFETNYNDFALQARWAQENQCAYLISQPDYVFSIFKKQVEVFKPDIVYIYAGAFFWLNRSMREELRNVAGENAIITGFWGDELPLPHTYRDYFGDLDYVFASSSVYERKLAQAGIPVRTIGNSFAANIKYRKDLPKKYDFTFSGVTGYGYPDHIGRYDRMMSIMERTDLKVWANEPKLVSAQYRAKIALLNFLAKYPSNIALRILTRLRSNGPQLYNLAMLLRETETSAEHVLASGGHPQGDYFQGKLSLAQKFGSRVKKPLVNTSEYYELLTRSKIVLNLHRDEDADIGNIRCYEATGVGACLATDRAAELGEFFDPENDFVGFNSVDELVEKVGYLLRHPKEIERIAQNGQKKTLSHHTTAHRCEAILEHIHEFRKQGYPLGVRKSHRTVEATYDLQKHPISFDIAFFLQAADIARQKSNANNLTVNLLWPEDVTNQPGVSREANEAVNSDGRTFRIQHILAQMTDMMGTASYSNVRTRRFSTRLAQDRKYVRSESDESVGEGHSNSFEVIPYPGPDVDHHSEYCRLINANPELMKGFRASAEARRYIQDWLDTFVDGRRVLCITLRQYKFDTQRNSNEKAWLQFLEGIDQKKYAIVVVPDTDFVTEFQESAFGQYRNFDPVCFDVDLRFALYELAFLNMFVNNGPGSAATLDKEVRYLMFKIIDESVPHCTEEFLEWNGFTIGETPKYASKHQKWVWDDDSLNVLKREFENMVNEIEAQED